MVQTSVWIAAEKPVRSDHQGSHNAICSHRQRPLGTPYRRPGAGGGPTCEGFGGQADGRGRRVLLRLGYCMATQAAILVKLEVEALTDHDRAGHVDDKSMARLMSGALGDSLGQLGQNRADAHRSRRGVQVAWSAAGRSRCPAHGSRRHRYPTASRSQPDPDRTARR
jgi:hypothetical protein